MEPYILFMNGKFLKKMKKSFKIGSLARKPFRDVAKTMGYSPKEVNLKEAKEYLYKAKITLKEAAIDLIHSLFLPGGTLFNKVYLTQEMLDLGDFTLLHFATLVGKLIKKTYFGCLVIPKNENGLKSSRNFFKTIISRVAEEPISEEEWKEILPARERFIEQNIDGSDRNLWIEISS